MTQIKLTPDDLRQSKHNAMRKVLKTSIVLTLTHEQQVIDANWGWIHLIALKHNSTNCLQNQTICSIIKDINGQLIKSC